MSKKGQGTTGTTGTGGTVEVFKLGYYYRVSWEDHEIVCKVIKLLSPDSTEAVFQDIAIIRGGGEIVEEWDDSILRLRTSIIDIYEIGDNLGEHPEYLL